MAKFHINAETGNVGSCKAEKGKCPFGGDENHFPSKEEARSAFEASVKVSESSPKKMRSDGFIQVVDKWGNVRWYNTDRQLHRDGDLPAFESPSGAKEWYQNGKRHRDNGPAIEYADGSKFWYQNDKRHRDGDLPAVEYSNGTKFWYQNDKRHRDGGLPAVEGVNGIKEWWVNGEFQYAVLPDGTRKDSYDHRGHFRD